MPQTVFSKVFTMMLIFYFSSEVQSFQLSFPAQVN